MRAPDRQTVSVTAVPLVAVFGVSFDTKIKIIYFVCLVAAVILHEISHGVVALIFGDDTAKRAGRLTLNPVPHIDPFGSVILPALAALGGFAGFGYAKPVPVNPARLRQPRQQMLFVSLAGPATNLSLMAIGAVAARHVTLDRSDPSTLFLVLYFFAIVNLFLGVFNLLPIPPLDGSSIIERFLPRKYLQTWWKYRQYGFLILILLILVFNGVLARIIDPFTEPLERYMLDR
jgi:Zn-dependent protease